MSKTAGRSLERVLVYRLGSLGDTVIALPSLHAIARAYPDADRRMLTSFPPNAKAPASSAILDHTDLIHGYFRYTYSTRSVRELAALWWQIVRWRPQVLVYLSGTRSVASAKRDALFFRMCGIRRLIGVPVTEEMQLPRRIAGTSVQTDAVFEFECARLARNIAEVEDARLDDAASWDLRLTEGEQARSMEALAPLAGGKFIAVSFGTKNQSNDWEPQNWHALLGRIAELYPAYSLVICGAAVEAQASEAAAAVWRERSNNAALNLCGALSPRESAAVFQRAKLFIGHDSGPTHLAAAAQTTCVAIFGARNPAGVWFPYGGKHRVLYHHVDCGGCQLITCIEQKKKCILSISVDEVLAEVADVLGALPGVENVRRGD